MFPAPDNPVLLAQGGSLDQLRQFAAGGYLYAVTCGTLAPRLNAQLLEATPENAIALADPSRFEGIVPHLLRVTPPMLEFIADSPEHETWGVFVLSKAPLESLRAHLASFLFVELPDGEQWFFRYYDPRLLPIYLANCNHWELTKFFGPVRAFAVPHAEAKNFTFLRFEDQTDPSQRDTDPSVSPVWHIRAEQVNALNRTQS